MSRSRSIQYSVYEMLSIIEDNPEVTRADVFISPPDDPNCSDEDSGDEDLGNVNNLTRRQVEAKAECTMHTGIGLDANKLNVGLVDDSDEIEGCDVTLGTLDVCSSTIGGEENVSHIPSRQRSRKMSLRVREALE